MEHCIPSSYPVAFVWGIIVILAMIGFGRMAGRVIDPEAGPTAGWGLHAVWGMAVYLFIGAILALCGWFGERVIILLILAGAGAMVWTSVRSFPSIPQALASVPWKTWPAFLIAAVTYAGGIVYCGRANPCDDWPAYFYFCEKLLLTGTFDEPFSWRRMACLGGHTLLQSAIVAKASLASASSIELAISPVLLLGLILGFRRGTLSRNLQGLFIALIALTTPIIRLNSASQLSGVIFFIGLFVTLDFIDRLGPENPRRSRWLVAVGFLVASASALRAQYVPASVGAVGLFWLASWIRDRRPRQAMLVELAWWGGAAFVALLPWMLMSYRSNETPLFPLFPGGNKLDFNPPEVKTTLFASLVNPVKMVLYPELLPLLLCLFALPDWRRALAARCVAGGMVVAGFMVAYNMRLAPDLETVPRYVQPMLLSAAIVALMAAAITPRTRIYAWVVMVIWVGASLQPRADLLLRLYAVLPQQPGANLPYGPQDIFDHRGAQALVPPGKRILVCSDYPVLFDHRRNPIWIMDMPHATSPSPGMPFQSSPEALTHYFRDLGVDYFIVVDFTKSTRLYSRSDWQEHADQDIPLWRLQAEYYLDFFNTVDRVAATETKLGKVGDLTVLQFKR